MRVAEYVAFRARLEGIPARAARDRAAEAISRCLLGEVANRRIENLSKGFRQRTALAGALVHQPPVLVLDEPTIGLDPVQIIKIRETIRELGRDRAVLLSTHILPEVEAVCDRVLIIDRGRIVAEGTPSDLRAKLAGTPFVRAAFRGHIAGLSEALDALPGVVSVEIESNPEETRARIGCAAGSDPREDVYRLAVSSSWVLRELMFEAASLEDVFVRLTRRDEAAVPADAAARVAAEEPDAGPAGPEEPPQ
jgi:gliding motility-associated transport system ATP-binding protein